MTAPATPRLIRTTKDLQAWSDSCRMDGRSIAMVPTMGALHAGHLSLVEAAAAKADAVVVSIFVNPTQFGPGEDFDAYPRTEASDVEKLTGRGVEVVFAPNAAEMYPEGFATTITVDGPASGLETDFRPHFFAGVATVVTKLLLAARPHHAFFGEKDYQQLLVVKRLSRDLNIGTEIVGRPTVREADDLALSSRNAYLDAPARHSASRLPAVLRHVVVALEAGAPAETALADGRAALQHEGFEVDYLSLCDADTLATPQPGKPRRLLVAARIGTTRLIDNMAVAPGI
ncbi:pantothenate synthetase [Breoghania corrubedonensis]|uniref:Pantothenate synthetase n=1 Tax=Breoghania corrubedonensis TaxID=665038 RepID=A0A2T5VCL3_9HYPH|nr:pantoate--beta-alanine ligase [Breoghania corrubedonensis]PTW61490.1 pantothenate synthetase [Breoghania corrubedonensis]